jgi:anti-anti-sigma regulatory factor
MLKITAADQPGQRVLKLDGKLLSTWVPALIAACRERDSQERLELDLDGLTFADTEGLDALRQLADRGIRLSNCSPFIGELIREHQS